MRRILVVGGGIAGVESAMTLARGLPEDAVTLLGHASTLRVLPDVLYVPAGVSTSRMDVPFRAPLVGTGVEVRSGQLGSVDLDRRVASTDIGDIPFDIVVIASGAQPMSTSGLQLQSAEDGVVLRDRLDALFEDATRRGARGSIIIRAAADDAWSPPAYELAALLATRRRMLHADRLVSITLLTAELSPFQWFEPGVADIVVDALQELGVELATGVPEARFDDMIADVVVDFGRLEARNVPGVPGRDERGWYATDPDGRVHDAAFVVGDAASHGFKAAFAAAWQSRRMLMALGGSLPRLGTSAGGVPIDSVEHHVDLGRSTLRIRLPIAAKLHDPWLGHDATTTLSDQPPDRLAGLLVGDAVRALRGSSAAQAHRALLGRSDGSGAIAGAPHGMSAHAT